MSRAAVLWVLLGLFVLRVAGQLAVALGWAPFLPPMQEWYSGLLPYVPLLISQLLIIVLFVKICLDHGRGSGYFARPNAFFATPLWWFGWIYAAAMVVRYVVTMMWYPERRWTGGTIPIAFHFVLAAFLLILADHHRGARVNGRHH
jgi:hypothetical protein